MVVIVSTLVCAETGKISGTVVDESGVPVKRITVEVFPLDRYGTWSGGTYSATTDQWGRFVVVVPVTRSFGYRWRVYPHQEGRYLPDLSARFYQTEESHGEIVELARPGLTTTVQVRLGRKAGVLKAKVTDAVTGDMLSQIECKVAWATEPNNWLHIEQTHGPVTLLLPSNIDVTLTVSSSGYKPWTYPGVINVGPGQELPLDIHLQRDNIPTQ